MKKILALTLISTLAFASANAHPKAGKHTKPQAPAPTPSRHHAKDQTKARAASDESANYIGTNDFYLALIREGVRKA
jgi:hypothetical protein